MTEGVREGVMEGGEKEEWEGEAKGGREREG